MAVNDATRSGLWVGRRKLVPLFGVGAAALLARGVLAAEPLERIAPFMFCAVCVFSGYWSWTHPTGEWWTYYHVGVVGEGRFGSKRWHKVSIGFLAAFAVLAFLGR